MSKQELFLRNKIKKYYPKTFDKELIDEIIKVGEYKKIKSGELLINIGGKMSHIPLILEGILKIIRKEKNGEEIVLYFLESGDTCAISFANCINKKRSIFKGIVEKDLEAIFIPVEYIDDWIVTYKSWRYFIIDSYHFRLLEMVDAIDSLAFMNLNERILKYLTHKAEINNNCELEITHLEIAHDLHTSRVVISRIMKQLNDENKISSARNKIRVLVPLTK
ncbi:CRP/FNR family transcriptional regulator [Mariniflexile fucanivorans]|uniref:CRP/FNR family transcriptional regulator n=1 Tax=Mariniflexile fucanivorans TaxID=264023 RepID=A0A4R1RNA9_9FLAO|nr:Crp/Fnr family transcriptional regulator [Mariniflexile fucanivorans]TCL67706.1 CRP/FNR family transcriptional regulator [Mariniflexile fucanivorans]